jgi:hypothetical protein
MLQVHVAVESMLLLCYASSLLTNLSEGYSVLPSVICAMRFSPSLLCGLPFGTSCKHGILTKNFKHETIQNLKNDMTTQTVTKKTEEQ